MPRTDKTKDEEGGAIHHQKALDEAAEWPFLEPVAFEARPLTPLGGWYGGISVLDHGPVESDEDCTQESGRDRVEVSRGYQQ